MSEAGYVELPILTWLCGEPAVPYTPGGLGWIYRDEDEMAGFERPLEDPIVEDLLIQAIIRINDNVQTEAQAKVAIAALRKTMSHPDRLTANRETLDLLRDGARVVIEPGSDALTVQFIAFDPDGQRLNDFCATNQYRVQGVKQCREDTVLLVNGIPLVIAEYKSYISAGKDWREAVHQLHRYQRQAPLIL
jgi:type I restriction enzyme R subunit